MFKHSKCYKPPPVVNREVPCNLYQLRTFISNKYKEKIAENDIDLAMSQLTKGQRRRFRRYGKIPIPIQHLLKRNGIKPI